MNWLTWYDTPRGTEDITKEARTAWGQYYRVDWAMPSRVDVVLRTIREIAPGAEIPRLVSVFIR
jgi:hypothetical protein